MEDKFMKPVKLFIRFFLSVFFGIIIFLSSAAQQTDSIELYTPYTKVSVSPGNTVNYSIDLINNGSKTQDKDISVTSFPRSWKYTLTAGGLNIKRLATLPGQKKNMTMKVEIPFKVNKGNYKFYVKAGNDVVLPLEVNISEQGSNESELTCDQANMEGTSKSTFSFKAILKNRTSAKQQYALMSNPPRGWTAEIKANYKQATSTEVEANNTKDITIDVKAPPTVKAGTYKIPVKAVTGSTSADLELEVVITGSYDLSVSTPNGLLSDELTAGNEKKIDLVVHNTGSAELKDISLSTIQPKKWEVTFEPQKVQNLPAGSTEHVSVTIKADKKAIPGDYVTKITAKTPEANSDVSFRITVRTPMLWGWAGVLIIFIALGSVFYLFKKFGRR
jgi:uncharacterized membrane protein